jgi:formyl-CoA transferase
VAIAVVGEPAWRRFAAAVAAPGLADDPRFATLDARLAHRAELDAIVAGWTAARDAEDAAATLQEVGVSAGVVQNGDDHRADAHLAARGAIVTVEHPEVGPERHAGNPLRFGATAVRHGGASPCLGADTDVVLGTWLGAGAEELAAWKSAKVLW